jgi:transglutaminase-like putative cysteine protease
MDQPASTFRDITPGARVAPPGMWVDVAPYDIPQTANPHFIANGVCVLLDDSQIDLCGPERAWFYRRADMVTANAGAERAAQFSVSFDPRFERVDVHSIAVIRAGARVEHTGTAFFEVLRRERNMERLLFDGRLTIHVTLPDVRVGDVVETSYTLYGMRKSLNGRHSAFVPFEWGVGIVETRLRQRTPTDRAIAERLYGETPQATQTEADGVIDRRWRTHERPGARFEPLAPPWIFQGAMIQFSEWRDWGEAAATFTPLYEDDGALSEEVEAEIARIAASEPAPAARAAAVLRFVQGGVRYLAISMGEGGYTPRPLADICETRYGDCKDKSKLYVAMARRLGLDACPALVNVRDGPALDQWLPTGQAFDHCIVRVRVDGKSHWLDPTQEAQVSPLGEIAQCRYGWALPLAPGVDALEHMGDEPHLHSLEANEHIVLGKSPSVPVKYEWRVTMRGWRAEQMRARVGREGEVGLFKLYTEDIQRSFPKAAPLQQEVVRDDHQLNELTTLEQFEISDAWTHRGDLYGFATLDLFMRSMLMKLDQGERKLPVDLGHVGKMTRRVEIETAVPMRVTPWRRTVSGSALNFEAEMRVIGKKKFELTQTLDVRAWTLPANEAQVYRDVVAELEKSDLDLMRAVKGGKFVRDIKAASRFGFWDMIRWAIVGALIVYLLSRFAATTQG